MVTSPRVEDTTPPPRVKEASPPRVPITNSKDIPNLIPADDSDDESSDDEDDEIDIEPTPRYNTRANTAKKKNFHSNVTRDAILSAVEMSFERLSPAKLAKRRFPLQVLCEIAGAVMDDETGELLEYRQLIKHHKFKQTWGKAFGNEIGRLAQGMPGRVEGTNTFFFINQDEIPADRKKDVTYARICCNVRPEKVNEPNRCRITVGGDRINYPYEVATPTADLLTVKLLLNSVISTEGAKFCSQ